MENNNGSVKSPSMTLITRNTAQLGPSVTVASVSSVVTRHQPPLTLVQWWVAVVMSWHQAWDWQLGNNADI